ncbi:MAG: hypothetical protein WC071_08005 [Victivallaceae bacterium]
MNSKNRPEITWSLMHPTPLDLDYMAEVISNTKSYDMDSFEICGQCHHPLGGLDGLMLYEKYPAVNATLDKEKIEANRATLRQILSMAHACGKPVLYWHREIMVPPGVIVAEPHLLDSNGEFDLLGEAFEQLLCYKLESAFAAAPELDGIVLTLTEADYSVIHNSSPDKYPPEKVVEKIVRIFAAETAKRGKRFVLRSFGSIASDYEDILAGAELAAKDFKFEIETKITPYDFVPFLPANPFLRPVPGATISAECDSLGEFLGAGYLPAANVENIVRYVNEGRSKNVARYAIRMDRVGNSIFRTYEVNLFAYHQAINHPDITAADIWEKWSRLRWPNCSAAMVELAKSGFEFAKKIHYVDGNVIFHMFPPDGAMKWVKAGGIFALFKNDISLANHAGIWSILAHKNTPGRDKIRQEKAEAVELAENGLKRLNELKAKLTEDEFKMAERSWQNAVVAGHAIKALVDCICAYFDDMEQGLEDCPSLKQAVAVAKKIYSRLACDAANTGSKTKVSSDAIEHHAFTPLGDNLDKVYVVPLQTMCDELLNEYRAEFATRKTWNKSAPVDLIVCGGICDEWRIGRYMHGSHTLSRNGFSSRVVGNRVFPNGYIEITINMPASGNGLIKIKGNPAASVGFKATVNNKKYCCQYDQNGIAAIPCKETGACQLRIEKDGVEYPEIEVIATFKA